MLLIVKSTCGGGKGFCIIIKLRFIHFTFVSRDGRVVFLFAQHVIQKGTGSDLVSHLPNHHCNVRIMIRAFDDITRTHQI